MIKTVNDDQAASGLDVADTPEAAPESLDKVRDILFGSQMRTVESRLQSLEERLRREQDAIRADLEKQAGELDQLIRSEAQTLGERLAAERAKRTEELKSLASDIKESIRNLEKRHAKLEEVTSIADAGLRDQLLAQSRAAATELATLGERLTGELSQSHQELKSTKTDRVALAELLSELANRIGGDEGQNGPRG